MEIEIKARVADFDSIKPRLKAIGAKFVERRREIDEYFSLKSRDFWKTLECLRIRSLPDSGEAILTYKPCSTDDMKDRKMFFKKELETKVDAPVARDILLSLDCVPLLIVYKEREYWEADGKYKISLDKVKDLGNFIEIEIEGEGADIDMKRAGMVDFLKGIGVDELKIVSQPYRCMLRKAV
jgi:adenylate cyclase class 2